MKPKHQTGKDRLDKSCSAKHTGSTNLENNLADSMMHVHPKYLYAKKLRGKIGRLEAGFAGCASYAIWITRTDCFHSQMMLMREKYCDGILGSVNNSASYYTLVLLLITNVRGQ
jgi:hypothetical protein